MSYGRGVNLCHITFSMRKKPPKFSEWTGERLSAGHALVMFQPIPWAKESGSYGGSWNTNCWSGLKHAKQRKNGHPRVP
jgi:hypothetical protein